MEITDSSSLHESVASTNLPSSSCCLILSATLISKMGLLDNTENDRCIECYFSFCFPYLCNTYLFVHEKMENRFYLFDFCSPLSSSRERSLRRGPHENWNCNIEFNIENFERSTKAGGQRNSNNSVPQNLQGRSNCLLMPHLNKRKIVTPNHECLGILLENYL